METFGVPACCLIVDALASLYDSGRFTGCVLDAGYEVVRGVPIVDGRTIRDCVTRVDIGGKDLDAVMRRRLIESGISFTSSVDYVSVDIKEKLAYASLDFDAELKRSRSDPSIRKNYELPGATSAPLDSNAPKSSFGPR